MDYFLSTFTNRIDKKGRVSVPAEYRAILTRRGSSRLYVNCSTRHPCIEGFGEDHVETMMKRAREYDYDSDDKDDFLDLTAASLVPLSWDAEGRIGLSDMLIQHARLGELAAFVGRGETFAIWSPPLFAARQAEARARAQARRAPGAGAEPRA